MKNIHILQTDHQSRLFYNKLTVLELDILQYRRNTQHIYITSDEKIKDGDWCISLLDDESFKGIIKIEKIHFDCDFDFTRSYKKIIITTNECLIRNGIQYINDDFLEWFIENPECKFVQIKKEHDDSVPYLKMKYVVPYIIIIPTKESENGININNTLKQETSGNYNIVASFKHGKSLNAKLIINKPEMIDNVDESLLINSPCEYVFETGTDWPEDKKYSKEDIKLAYSIGWTTRERFNDISPDIIYPTGLDYEGKQDYSFNLWFEKFKNN
jgi:hypothetical protein